MDFFRQFHETVSQYGNTTALTWQDKDYSYYEIDRLSSLVAVYLSAKQITHRHIGCCMQRTALWPIALLGLLKARCSYTPLDFANPKARIMDIIDDAGISLVITDDACTIDFGSVPSVNINDMLRDGSAATVHPDSASTVVGGSAANTLPEISPDDLAYIFYTSGTTGKPKGIPATFGQLALIPAYWLHSVFHTAPGEHVLQMAGMNFHVSLMETLAFLVGGTHIFMLGDEEKKDPTLLVRWLNEKRIERAFIPPAVLAVMPRVELPFLKTIVIAGEPCPKHVRDYWLGSHTIVNTYGCTETTVCIGSDIQYASTPVNNVGRLNPALQGIIVDEELHEVPDGTAGELCISGPSVTAGYLNLPQVNTQRFFAHGGLTFFRTGDRVEKMPDGTLMHKGRVDDQVKIRGMRIETREIELALESHPLVAKAVVVAKLINDHKRLVAYVRLDKDLDTDQLKQHLSALLPDFMCPTVYVKMEAFPVNINNKVMRSQLPDPVIEDTGTDRSSWNETEKRIADIIFDILGQMPDDLFDTFVAVGGDSISSIAFVDRLNKVFHTNMNVRDLQQHATISQLANFILTSDLSPLTSDLSPLTSDLSPLPQSLKDLWVSCQKSNERNAAYKMFFVFSFDEQTDVKLLEQAWNKVVETQEALRLVFILQHDGLVGNILPYDYQEIALESISTEDFPSVSSSFYHHTELSTTKGLYAIRLFQLSDGTLKLCVVIHHLITDGLSYQLMSRKLNDYYASLLANTTPTDDIVSYRQYLEWKVQQEQTDKPLHISYWEERLNPLPGNLGAALHANLGAATPLPSEGRGRGGVTDRLEFTEAATKRLRLTPHEDTSLRQLCRQEDITPASVFLTLFGYIVGKFCAQSDFLIAMAATDREEVRFINTMGYMVSMLPIRTSQETDKPFLAAVRAMAQQTTQARSHIVPLSDIMAIINATEESDFINIGFGMENTSLDILLSENLVQPAPFALTLYVGMTREQTDIAIQYARTSFPDEAVDSMFTCFHHVLGQLLTHPDTPLDHCRLTAHTSIHSDPAAQSDYKSNSPAYCTPHSGIAYRINNRDYTYAETHQLAEAISALIPLSSGNNVGVCLYQKDYLIPAIIALFRRNATYVPIDPELPTERIRHILDDARITLVITDNDLCAAIPSVRSVNISDMLRDASAAPVVNASAVTVVDGKTVNSLPDVSPAGHAYIIFTSGSTGKPKGIPISHANLAVFCRNFCAVTGLKSGMRVLQFASVGFDASVLEIFPALSVGATVVFPTAEERKSTTLLLDLMERERISLALIPPPLLSILPYRPLPSLTTLLVGGDSTPKDVQERWRAGRRLINAYGPTENTVMATAMEMQADTPHNNIGYPLGHVTCLVMDPQQRPLPDYAIGELCIGGAQLSDGYINNDEQNRLHFLTHPRYGRLYRSGDKVVRTKDGSFLFLGRIDSQVKIRGFRVELSEIVKVLEDIDAIRQAYVTLKPLTSDPSPLTSDPSPLTSDPSPLTSLIAYCVRSDGAVITEEEVIDHLSTLLPHYMVPSAVVFLDAFPLTVNNKIDTKRLPIPAIQSVPASPMVDASAANKQTEQSIAAIVATLLQRHPRVTANLFHEGLTSITAMQLSYLLTQAGMPYSYSDIYRAKTIRTLAAATPSEAWHWHHYDSAKPVVVLVCGYTPLSPFYDDYLAALSRRFSVLCFDAFSFYYTTHPGSQCNAADYTDYMYAVVTSEMNRLNTTVYALTGHSIGSELAIMLAQKLLSAAQSDSAVAQSDLQCRVIAIGTSYQVPLSLLDTLSDEHILLKRMQSSMPVPRFDGDLRLVLEQRPSNSLTLPSNDGAATPPSANDGAATPLPSKGRGRGGVTTENLKKWQHAYPAAIIKQLDTDHFGLLQPQFIDAIMALF